MKGVFESDVVYSTDGRSFTTETISHILYKQDIAYITLFLMFPLDVFWQQQQKNK